MFGACAFAGCKDAVVDPGGTPTTIEVVTAAPTNGVVNTAVAPGPSFLVKNENGQPMGAAVSIAVTGGGALAGQPAKSNAGATGIGTWTLGKTAGANTVTVTVGSLAPITYTVTGTAAAPKKVIEVNPPATQRSALANAIVTGPIVVAVADTFNNAIAGQVVNFTITGGSGTLIGNVTITTDANGQATAPAWQLGKSAIPQTLRATSGVVLPADINATVQTNYRIVVRFFGATTMSASQQAIFTNAAQRIMGIVTGDVTDVQLTNQVISGCTAGQANLTEVVDDIVIYAESKPIDGVGLILGSAGPCFVRASGPNCAAGCAGIALMGHMEFDTADLAQLETNGTLQDVIQHEMLHVVGFGSLWLNTPFSLATGTGTSDPRYVGAQGIAGCQATGGTVSCASYVPLAGAGCPPSGTPGEPAECKGGTRDAHWLESTFGRELMTGFLNNGTNPLSALTIRSLQDFGYVVNAGDADSYTIAAGSILAGSSLRTPVPTAPWELLNQKALYSIDASGRVKLLRNPQ